MSAVLDTPAPPNRWQGRLSRVLSEARSEFAAAAGPLNVQTLGPGPVLEAEWQAAGLELPDLPRMRRYRLARVQRQLREMDLAGIVVMDPMNIRYLTDVTNMQVWVMHNGARYAYVGADGPLILWDYVNCEYMSGHNPLIDEVRPAICATFFGAGTRQTEKTRAWANEIADLVEQSAGAGARIAVDQTHYESYRTLEARGLSITSGQEVMEMARSIKGEDEIRAMRCSAHACLATMVEMREAMRPGMTERELWSLLHAGNIRRAGEFLETQLLSSGPRTNPWMQEASSRVIEDGDIVAYDTDLVGAYGMMVDISRTWVAGDNAPTQQQAHTHALAAEQMARNFELLTPGRTFHELTHQAHVLPLDEYRHYSVLFHGVGQCDEYPQIVFPEYWDEWGFDGVLKPGMVLTVESYVGPLAGGEGIKLEDQVLVTEYGPERLTGAMSLDLR